MNNELTRLSTFHSWPLSFIDKHQLARFGFFYYGPGDLVKCFFCDTEIGMWEEGDDVLTDHIRWSQNTCPLILGHPTNNVPIDEDLLREQLPPPAPVAPGEERGEDVIGVRSILFSDFFANFNLIADQTNQTSVRSKYMLESERVKSFIDWPVALKQKPAQLSDAGFFYEGKGDRVSCFSCGGGLKDWYPEDDPWEQHAMNYKDCQYLIQMKGAEFVKQVQEKKKGVIEKKVVEIDDSDDETNETPNEKCCKICLEQEHNTVFIPCGHICACVKCAFSVEKCPLCREPYERIVRTFYS